MGAELKGVNKEMGEKERQVEKEGDYLRGMRGTRRQIATKIMGKLSSSQQTSDREVHGACIAESLTLASP